MPLNQSNTISPACVANARAQVDVKHADRFHPALTLNAWCILKEARGQRVDLYRLSEAAHLISAAEAPATPPAPGPISITDIRDSAMDRARRHAGARGYPMKPLNGGDAA